MGTDAHTDAREELREHIETAEQERAAYITAVNLRAAQLHGQIEGLKAALALLTNGEAANQRRNIERHGLAAHFDCIVIEGEFGVGKPDERVFQHALAVTSSTPEATWMIGDSLESDIAPAVSMGLHGVWVDPDGLGVPADAAVQPHRVVRAISELM